SPVTLGVGKTVKFTPLLSTPLACTTTLPVVAPDGTVVTMEVDVQLVGVAGVPLNLSVPWAEPKFVPVMVTDVPTGPELVERLVMLGAGTTVKATPLLAKLLTVTTILPVVAPAGTTAVIDVGPQLPIDVAVVPLNFTVLLPCDDPKFVPVITTE